MKHKSLAVIVVTGLFLVSAPWLAAPAPSDREEHHLSLADCLRMALENNLELVSARYGPQFAELDVEVNQARFDIGFESSYQHEEAESQAAQASAFSAFERDTLNVGIGQGLKSGVGYTAGFQFVEAFRQSGDIFSSNAYTSNFSIGVTVPILKGFGTEPTTELLILARSNLEISRTDLEGLAETVMETVEGAYWNVVAAREALRIARLSLGRAEDLLKLNRKKVEVGTLAPIDVTEAEAGVASQEGTVIVAETTLVDAEDELRRLMAIPDADPLWNSSIINTNRPVLEERTIDVEAAIATALENRAEIINARQVVRNNELSASVAHKKVRHQLDLDAGYTFSGSDLDDPAKKAQLSEAISNTFSGDEFGWNAQVTYRVPIGNRDAKANYARARYAQQQSVTDLEKQELSIRVEVRAAARAVDSGIKRVAAERKNVELQTKRLDAEQKKFENGMSTSFLVLTAQTDLADAELSAVRAALDYIKALTALERSKGTLLESRGLSLAGD